MLKTLKNAWKIPELKNKLLFTLLIIVLYRIVAAIPVPYFNYGASIDMASTNGILAFLSTLSGGALAQGTLLALGVSPYITSSIVVQLLTIAIPPLERLSKQGEEGKKKINFITRIITIVIAIITGIGYTSFIMSPQYASSLYNPSSAGWVFDAFVMVSCYCAGAMIVMWFAEKINDHGIGNGISIILFANIVTGFFQQAFALKSSMFSKGINGGFNYVGLIITIAVVLAIIALVMMIVWMSDAERRIPIQYAKRVVGRKMYGGQNTNLPIKVNMSGVMPIIFANSIVSIPGMIAGFMTKENGFTKFVNGWFNYNTPIYLIVFFVLLIAFAYFYVAISFNPVEVANNIKNNGGAIPGIRSGKPTVEFIKKVLGRITLVGALLVAVVACVPMLAAVISSPISSAMPTSLFASATANLNFIAFGGSSLMIVVGVALETTRELEAQMSLRNYKGFLD